jgi:hypothetical protein
MSERELTWIESAGGPLILLEEHLLSHWHGIQTDDYDRACGIDDYLGLLDVGSGRALVLGEEPMPTAWQPLSAPAEGMFVRWQYADDNESVVEAIADLSKASWEVTGIVYDLTGSSLLLFDATCPGEDPDCNRTGCKLNIVLKEKRYLIETANYTPDDNTALILHRFVKTE